MPPQRLPTRDDVFMLKASIGAYCAVVALVAGTMWHLARENERPLEVENPMIAPIPWSKLAVVTVPAVPTGFWTLAHDFLQAGTFVKLEANGEWSFSKGTKNGPDGDPGALLTAAAALEPKAPVGALIAKVGGSTAGAADGDLFTVGSYAVIKVKAAGSLYLTINDHPTGFKDNDGALTVNVSIYMPPSPAASESEESKASDKTDGS